LTKKQCCAPSVGLRRKSFECTGCSLHIAMASLSNHFCLDSRLANFSEHGAIIEMKTNYPIVEQFELLFTSDFVSMHISILARSHEFHTTPSSSILIITTPPHCQSSLINFDLDVSVGLISRKNMFYITPSSVACFTIRIIFYLFLLVYIFAHIKLLHSFEYAK
jgi:hypothetical protein